jgi:hypothetical protein
LLRGDAFLLRIGYAGKKKGNPVKVENVELRSVILLAMRHAGTWRGLGLFCRFGCRAKPQRLAASLVLRLLGFFFISSFPSMSKSDSPPTKEISSLTQVFEDETLALLFRDFLHANSCAENLAFWLAVEEFKTITEDRQRRKAAEKIYKKFFTECDIPVRYLLASQCDSHGYCYIVAQKILSAHASSFVGTRLTSKTQINVDASVKDEVSIQLESPDEISTKIYDSCQEAIYSMLEFDSFRKFLTSDAYKTYLGSWVFGNSGGCQ